MDSPTQALRCTRRSLAQESKRLESSRKKADHITEASLIRDNLSLQTYVEWRLGGNYRCDQTRRGSKIERDIPTHAVKFHAMCKIQQIAQNVWRFQRNVQWFREMFIKIGEAANMQRWQSVHAHQGRKKAKASMKNKNKYQKARSVSLK